MGSLASPFLVEATGPAPPPSSSSSRQPSAARRGDSGSSGALWRQATRSVEVNGLPDLASQQDQATELLRQLEEVLRPSQSVAARLQEVLQGAEVLRLDLEMPEASHSGSGADLTWSEWQEYVRMLRELHARRDGLSTAVRSCAVSASGSHAAFLLGTVLGRLAEVSQALAKVIQDTCLNMGDALQGMAQLQDCEVRNIALSSASELLELLCHELRCRKLDRTLAVEISQRNLFPDSESKAMALGAYDIAEGALTGSRQLQARIISQELSHKGVTFHGLSDQCRDLQNMWQACSKLVAGTDEAFHCYSIPDAERADIRYVRLLETMVLMGLEGIRLLNGALGEAPMGMVVVEDDLLLQYWMPEALTGLQRLVEEADLRVRYLETHQAPNAGTIRKLQQLAEQLPEKLYSLVLKVIVHVDDIGSEGSLWFQNIIMTPPHLWCDEDVGALQSLEQFATKVLAFVRRLFYSGSSNHNHLELCGKLEDQLSSRIICATSSCCTLVKEIRDHLSVYENAGSSALPTFDSLSQPSVSYSIAESELSDSAEETRQGTSSSSGGGTATATATAAATATGPEGGPRESEGREIPLVASGGSANGSLPRDAAGASIPTVTARELKIDKSNMAGEGSFGKVYPGSWYRAKVAVKVLNASRGRLNSEGFWKNFQTEWLACQLAHPNIVRFINVVWLHDVMSSRVSGRDARELCIVMEWCGYGDLFHLLKTARAIRDAKDKKIPEPTPEKGDESRYRWATKFYQVWDVRLEIAIGVAAGMAYMHSCNFLHRDLKSSNVLLALGWSRGNNGTDVEHIQPKIGDFDGARRLKEGCSKLQSNTYLSVLYQAPETLQCRDIGKPADVFSFGVLLWELITLDEPWADIISEKGDFVINYVVHNVPKGTRLGWPKPRPCEPRLHCREKMQALVQSCWNENPAKRPTMEELLTRLTKLREVEKAKAQEHYRRHQQYLKSGGAHRQALQGGRAKPSG
mmetsp:Transcript_19225/g.53601  ORF Transcript_19225/g.53601 Transcript_19225/m.53601 type:complete len:976 (+) Transcript_19225:394-3321(+)